MAFSTRVHGEHFTFSDLKTVLARANELRSGDQQAGLAAKSMREMAAAKQVLAEITMEQLYNAPSVPYEADEVTRVVVDALDARAYAKVKAWPVSQLREWPQVVAPRPLVSSHRAAILIAARPAQRI